MSSSLTEKDVKRASQIYTTVVALRNCKTPLLEEVRSRSYVELGRLKEVLDEMNKEIYNHCQIEGGYLGEDQIVTIIERWFGGVQK